MVVGPDIKGVGDSIHISLCRRQVTQSPIISMALCGAPYQEKMKLHRLNLLLIPETTVLLKQLSEMTLYSLYLRIFLKTLGD